MSTTIKSVNLYVEQMYFYVKGKSPIILIILTSCLGMDYCRIILVLGKLPNLVIAEVHILILPHLIS